MIRAAALVGVLGYASNALVVRLFERRLLRWEHPTSSSG